MKGYGKGAPVGRAERKGRPRGPFLPSARRYLSVDCSHAGRVSFDGGATPATAKSLCSEIRTDYEHCCDQLCYQRFDCWKNREPESHPSRDVRFKKLDRRSWNPFRQLHFLSLLTDHHKQHDAKQNAGSDEHFPIWEALLKNKCEARYHARQHEAEQRALQYNPAAQSQIIALQEKHDLKSFRIQRGEPEQDQTPPKTFL